MNAPLDTDRKNGSERYEPFRVVTDYEALQEAFIDRIEDLNVSRLTINEVGGFTSGYSEKLLCKPPMKTMGNGSLAKMLKATGMALMLVIDDERFAEVKEQLKRPKRKMRTSVRIKRVKGFFTKHNAGLIRKKAWAEIPPHVRKRMMSRIAKARWKAERSRSSRLALEGACPSSYEPLALQLAPVNAG